MLLLRYNLKWTDRDGGILICCPKFLRGIKKHICHFQYFFFANMVLPLSSLTDKKHCFLSVYTTNLNIKVKLLSMVSIVCTLTSICIPRDVI